jgi:hypothetical protein
MGCYNLGLDQDVIQHLVGDIAKDILGDEMGVETKEKQFWLKQKE